MTVSLKKRVTQKLKLGVTARAFYVIKKTVLIVNKR